MDKIQNPENGRLHPKDDIRWYEDRVGKLHPQFPSVMEKYVTIDKDRDLPGAVMSDGRECVIARGARNLPRVVECYVGSRGRAVILYERRGSTYALEYSTAAKALRVLDYFDLHEDCQTQTVIFKPLSKSQTKAGRKELALLRKEETAKKAKKEPKSVHPVMEPSQGKSKFTQTHTNVNSPNSTKVPVKEPEKEAGPVAQKKTKVHTKKKPVKERRFGVPHRENPPSYDYVTATVIDPDLPNWGQAGE